MNYTQQQMPSNISTIDLKVGEIVEFINNPDIEKTADVVAQIQNLSNMQFDLQIEYQSSKYCALSGIQLNETNQDDIISHDGYSFLASEIREYYRRGEFFDISIGDLEFEYYDGISRIPVQIELTQQLISKVFSNYYADFPQKQMSYQLLLDLKKFICQQTQKKYYMSDRIIYNNQDVSIHWAQDNIHLLDSVQSQYVQGYQKVLSQIALRY
ncbi:hypothetical protein (macronuclear) [Paramecium tetraurelia strain d4-2]|uniref:Uncharacterized protein n=1 Tax=Paramecium tetraurelia TaxID=5888 RepID=Q6BGL1_PARTE|nr:hypothetical protein [Paramecium tetraurelia strain d4-2]CAH03209.1 hypothetical protein PTMB.12c [Paramecium tetraurelia]